MTFRDDLVATSDWVAAYLETAGERPVFPAVTPGEIRAKLPASPPERAEPFAEVLRDLDEVIMPGLTLWNHPRFFAYFANTGSEPGILAELLTAALNVNAMAWVTSPAATELEQVVLDWLAQLLGLPAGMHGHIEDTASTSTLAALAAARTLRPGGAVYASEQAHNSIARACDVLGLGRRALRPIRTDDAFRVRPDELARAIESDRAAGVIPVAVVGAAGTTSTGAVDPLAVLADICAEHEVWFHIDGAYGAPAAAAPSTAALFRGLERADSVAIDPHKWLYLPKAVGCVLLRDGGVLGEAFADEPEYLENVGDGPYAGPVWPVFQGIEVTHPFRGLGPWMAFLAYGADALVAAVENDLRLARLLAEAVREAPELELLDEPQLSIVVYRHHPPGLDDPAALDAHNRALLDAMQRDGRVLTSGTTIRGAFALRPCMTHHRSSDADVLALAEVASELGAGLANMLPR